MDTSDTIAQLNKMATALADKHTAVASYFLSSSELDGMPKDVLRVVRENSIPSALAAKMASAIQERYSGRIEYKAGFETSLMMPGEKALLELVIMTPEEMCKEVVKLVLDLIAYIAARRES